MHRPRFRKCTCIFNSPIKFTFSSFQDKYMQEEFCICVNESDQVKGYLNKKNCHIVKNGKSVLHRAFSLFVFRNAPLIKQSNSVQKKLQLLMQQRASTKLTYPSLWSNTCCSHPLKNYPNETIENEATGVRIAAQRKIQHELGIDSFKYMPLPKIRFLTRIIYFALNEPSKETYWAEHEIDYLLIHILNPDLPTSLTDSKLFNLNIDEVSSIKWIDLSTIENIFNLNQSSYESNNDTDNLKLCPHNFTPWFRGLTYSGLLKRIWNWAENYSVFPDNQSKFYGDNLWDHTNIIKLDI